jgi:hypothetical protein
MRSTAVAAFSLHLDLAADEAVRALEDRGVRAIVLKGPSIAMWLYPDGARRYNDIDLLVPVEGLPAAREVLVRLGYTGGYAPLEEARGRPGHIDHHAEYWRRRDASIDLHWRIPGMTAPAERAWEVLAEHVESLPIAAQRALPVLTPPARALHVALHCAQHAGIAEGHPLRDLERLVATLPDETWPQVARLAAEVGAAGALAVGLGQIEEGREIAERHGIRSGIDDLYVALNAIGAPPSTAGLSIVAQGLRGRASARDVARVLFPPRTLMHEQHPLARRGRTGLAAAYVVRLGDRLLHLPRASVALRRARRLLRNGA